MYLIMLFLEEGLKIKGKYLKVNHKKNEIHLEVIKGISPKFVSTS